MGFFARSRLLRQMNKYINEPMNQRAQLGFFALFYSAKLALLAVGVPFAAFSGGPGPLALAYAMCEQAFAVFFSAGLLARFIMKWLPASFFSIFFSPSLLQLGPGPLALACAMCEQAFAVFFSAGLLARPSFNCLLASFFFFFESSAGSQLTPARALLPPSPPTFLSDRALPAPFATALNFIRSSALPFSLRFPALLSHWHQVLFRDRHNDPPGPLTKAAVDGAYGEYGEALRGGGFGAGAGGCCLRRLLFSRESFSTADLAHFAKPIARRRDVHSAPAVCGSLRKTLRAQGRT